MASDGDMTGPAGTRQGLKRGVSLPLLTLYGLGTTIGAGIFVLIGKIAAVSGIYAPLAFLTASLIAGLSAFSFMEMSSRYPEAAGEAAYVTESFGSRTLGLIVGLLVVAAGLISTSAIIIGFAGYLGELTALPAPVSQAGIVILLAVLVAAGVGVSVMAAAIVTLLEVGVLVALAVLGVPELAGAEHTGAVLAIPADGAAFYGIMAGAVLAFYAFIGFEDIVNLAEETRNPRRALPAAILLTLICTAVLYMLAAIVGIGTVDAEKLAASPAPLALIFEELSAGSGRIISAIAVISVLNGALVQIIMASRVLYGLSRRGLLPGWLGTVLPRVQTPGPAILISAGTVMVLTLSLDIVRLAGATSIVALCIFTLVNAALLRLKWSGPPPEPGPTIVPAILPALGIIASLALIGVEAWRVL